MDVLTPEGTWLLAVTTRRGVQEVTLRIRAVGSRLEGRWLGPRSEEQMSDIKVDGNRVEWSLREAGSMTALAWTFRGALEGDSMAGVARMGQVAMATFTADRQPI